MPFLGIHRYITRTQKKHPEVLCLLFGMVREKGLEPLRLAVLTPEASASTNSATLASLAYRFLLDMATPMRVELMTVSFGN